MPAEISFIIGAFVGVILSLFSIVSGNTQLISIEYKCEKTGFIGETPHRKERCVQFIHEDFKK